MAMNLSELGSVIREYRTASGLSQNELATLASISRATLIALEKGQLKELGASKLFAITDLLGVGLSYNKNVQSFDATVDIKKAVNSANVSYRAQLSAELLEESLLEGSVPKGYEGNFLHFVDEVPVPTILGVIRAVAARQHKKPKEVWRKTYALARQMKSPRALWHVAN